MVRWWSVVCLGCAVALGCGRSVHRGGGAGASTSAGGDGATGGSGSGTGGAGSGGSSGGKGDSDTGGTGGTATSGGTGGTAGVGGSAGSAGQAGGTGGVTGGAGSGGAAGEAGAPAATECMLVVRLDECCSQPRPVTRAEFDAEPCYREISRTILPRDAYCEPIPCPAITCELSVPSRVVELGPNGACDFVSECGTSTDCALGVDRNQCCSCPEAFPKRLLSKDSCVTPVDTTSSKVCAECGGVLCESCGELLPIGCLVRENALNWCGFVAPHDGVTESQCITEQPCVAATGPGIRCYSPGEAYCAGPAPPPDECDADTDCSDSSFICEPLGHCGQKQCITGCGSDDDCAAHEQCAADRRCVPRTCGLESDCGPIHGCIAGTCTRRECDDSNDCSGFYCVKGECFDEPGRCLDAEAP